MHGFRHPYTWGRDHPLVMDALIAAAVLSLGVLAELYPPEDPDGFRDGDALSVALTVVAAVPLVVRRRHPVSVFGVTFAVAAIHGSLDYLGAGGWVAMLLALYAVAAYGQRRSGVVCLAVALTGSVIGLVTTWDDMDADDVVASFVLPGAAWVLGDNVRVRRAYVQAVEDRAEELERGREAEARRAVVEERSRIARELHDIVAHNMSVMVVQAGAARRTLERDVDRASEAISQIEATGRGALDEMRRLVGVLRRDDTGPTDRAGNGDELMPKPGIDDVPGLVERCREAGLDVTYQVLQVDATGEPAVVTLAAGQEHLLPEGAQLVVYRVVQEALTNVMKHAGPGARARVTLTYGGRWLSLMVVDDGRGAATAVSGSAGSPVRRHGLAGMWERVSLYNGEMRWGPSYGGGFRVSVRLPLGRGRAEAGQAGAGRAEAGQTEAGQLGVRPVDAGRTGAAPSDSGGPERL